MIPPKEYGSYSDISKLNIKQPAALAATPAESSLKAKANQINLLLEIFSLEKEANVNDH